MEEKVETTKVIKRIIIELMEDESIIMKGEGVSDSNKAIELLLKNQDKADSLVSVGKIHLENPKYAKVLKDDFLSPFCANVAESGDMNQSDVFFPYGVIYLSKIPALQKYNSFYQPTSIPYYIERWQNYEVDDIFDFHCIEAIIKLRGIKK